MGLGTYPMDFRPWDAIGFTFQGGIIAFLDINKAATLRVHCVYRGRYAHLQIMAQTHWRLLRRPLYFAGIISWKRKGKQGQTFSTLFFPFYLSFQSLFVIYERYWKFQARDLKLPFCLLDFLQFNSLQWRHFMQTFHWRAHTAVQFQCTYGYKEIIPLIMSLCNVH